MKTDPSPLPSPLGRGSSLKISGLPTPGAAAYWAWERLAKGERLALVCRGLSELEELEGSLQALAPLFEGVDGSRAVFTEDSLTLSPGLDKLAAGARVALIQEEVLAKALPDPAGYASERLKLRPGHGIPRSELLTKLAKLGYRREDFAESPGEFAVRGSVTDFCLPEGSAHVRIFWDEDRVESMRQFDSATQRTEGFLTELAIPPVTPEGSASLADWLVGFEWLSLSPDAAPGLPEGASFLTPSGGEDFGARANPRFQGNLGLALRQVKAWLGEGSKVLLYSLNKGEDERMQESLEGKVEGCQFLIGPLARGFHHEGRKLAILTASEIYERSYRARANWAAPKRGARWSRYGNTGITRWARSMLTRPTPR